MSVFDFYSRTMFDFDFLSRTMSVFDFVRLCSTLFDYTGHCSTLFDFARLCSTILDNVRLFDFVRLQRILFDFVSILSRISRKVLNYNDTRTSLECFCQITFQKPQPGQPQNIIQNATKMSIVDSCRPS